MRIKITESQLNRLLNEDIYDLFKKVGEVGEDKLTPSEKKTLSALKKHMDMGGDVDEFEYEEDTSFVEGRGKVIKSKISNMPISFEYDDKITLDDETIEFYGTVIFGGISYFGMVISDRKGYFIEYDFYDEERPDIRLQDVVEGLEHEIENFFQEDIINQLM
jgi:hypothetical protein